MTVSMLIRELTDYLLEHGDREVITSQQEEDGDYTYGDTATGLVDYGDGTVGLVGHREETPSE